MPHAWREIRIAPRTERPFNAREWMDALVIVKAGVLELESLHGARRCFGLGSTLFLSGLRLRVLRNPGPITTVLSAATRMRHYREFGSGEKRGQPPRLLEPRDASRRSMGENRRQPT
jgi:hypothetical protein